VRNLLEVGDGAVSINKEAAPVVGAVNVSIGTPVVAGATTIRSGASSAASSAAGYLSRCSPMMRKKMDRAAIAAKAEALRAEAKRVPDPSMSNYKNVLATYKRLLNDVLVLIRELAESK
jgi:hypothetical protein